MFRCLTSSCPLTCHSSRTPSCMERLLCRVLLFLLAATLLVSVGAGVRLLHRSGDLYPDAVSFNWRRLPLSAAAEQP